LKLLILIFPKEGGNARPAYARMSYSQLRGEREKDDYFEIPVRVKKVRGRGENLRFGRRGAYVEIAHRKEKGHLNLKTLLQKKKKISAISLGASITRDSSMTN